MSLVQSAAVADHERLGTSASACLIAAIVVLTTVHPEIQPLVGICVPLVALAH